MSSNQYNTGSYPAGSSAKPSSSGTGGGLGKELKNIGKFISHNKMGAATTAFNYKMGGTLGKGLAAYQTYDMTKQYKHEKKAGVYDDRDQYGQQQQFDQHEQYGGQQQQQYGGQQQQQYGGQQQQFGGQQQQHYSNQPQYGSQPRYGSPSHSKQDGLSKMGADLKQTGTKVFGQASHLVSEKLGTDRMKDFVSNGQVQLVSAVSGRSLQVMKSQAGGLVLDCQGTQGPQAWNAVFTVVRCDAKVVMLHNNNNFVAIDNGHVVLFPNPPSVPAPAHCQLRVHKCAEGVSFESAIAPGQVIAVENNGFLKPTFGNDCRRFDASFIVHRI